jgi:hypothetical protein
MILGENSHIALIKLYSSNNGGTIGDAWGEFIDPVAHNDKSYFTVGEWLFFSINRTAVLNDFVQESGTCEFTGPFKRKHLTECANDCEDFATV